MPTRKPKPKRPTAKESASYIAGYTARSLEVDRKPPPIKVEDVQREVIVRVLGVIKTRQQLLRTQIEGGGWFTGKLLARLDELEDLRDAIVKAIGGK